MKIIKASTTYGADTAGVPISYKFSDLTDQSLAQIAFTSQYTTKTPVRLKETVRIAVTEYKVTAADDEGSDNAVDMITLGL